MALAAPGALAVKLALMGRGGEREPAGETLTPNAPDSALTLGRSVQRAGIVPMLPSTKQQRTIVSPCSVRHPNTSNSTPRNTRGAATSRTRAGNGSTT